jgi:hypothetical protein
VKTKAEAIRAFLAAGFPIIPLDGKKPVESQWENSPLSKHDEKTIGSDQNYGVVLGAQDLVVDVDPRNYEKDDKPLDRLAKAIGGIPAGTLVTKTGGGGLHIFLEKPRDLSVRNAIPEFRGIEFKAGPGRQVVGPGSVHPETGKGYFHLQGSPASVAQAPQALLDLIKRLPVKDFGAAGTAAYQDDEATRARCFAYLMMAPTVGTYKVVCGLRDLGVSPKVALQLLLESWNDRRPVPKTEEQFVEKIQHAYTYAKGAAGSAHPAAYFDKVESAKAQSAATKQNAEDVEEAVGKSGWKLDNKKQPVSCLQNTLNYLSLPSVGLRGCFGYNEFARRVDLMRETPWRALPGLPVSDIDLQRMRAHLARNHGYETGMTNLVDAMVDVSQFRRFHPVKEYLNALKWDGESRLDGWLSKYLGVEAGTDGYAAAVGRKTLVAAVARVYEPGIKFDHVLVLEGRQGLGKSGVCAVLGGEWFSDFKMNVGDKDTIQMMQGKWLVEMPDLHATRQADIDMVKSFLTRQVDEARMAYGRLPGRYPRQGIFIGTYNPGPDGTYLKDDENRRWWPVMCHAVVGPVFDFVGLKAVRDMLWAEAVALYRKGEALKMDTTQLQDAARAAQAERVADHPWAERVGDWIKERDKNKETREDFYTGREVFIGAMGGMDVRYSRHEQIGIAKALKDLKWSAGFKWRDGGAVRGFWRAGVAPAPARSVKKEEAMSVFGDLA